MIPLVLITCDDEPAPACGDGVIQAAEQCDDSNLHDGDGCSAVCRVEYTAPSCVGLTESAEAVPYAFLVTPDGRVLVGGAMSTSGEAAHAWIGTFETDGTPSWSLDLDEDAAVRAIVQTGDVFVLSQSSFDADELLTIDANGQVVDSIGLTDLDPDAGRVRAMADTPNGLILGGVGGNADLWLARRGSDDGLLETLVLEDHAGYDDSFVALARGGGVVAALGVVGLSNASDGDAIEPDLQASVLVEYDEQGVELRRTLLDGDGDETSMVGLDLAAARDGTWVIGGATIVPSTGRYGPAWAAGVRGGQTVWTASSPSSVQAADGSAVGTFHAVAAADEILLLGKIGAPDGVVRLAIRLTPEGESVWEQIGEAASGPDTYAFAESDVDGRAWLLGSTRHTDRVEQWLCNAQL